MDVDWKKLDTSNRDFASEILLCRTSYDVFRVQRALTEAIGYRYFMVFSLPDEADVSIAERAIITNWDPGLISAYDQMGFLSDSPVIKSLRQSTLPMVWRLETINRDRSDGRERDVTDLFSDFGIYAGVYFHVTDPQGNVGAVGFCGDRPDPDERELMELSYLSSHLYEQLANLNVQHNKIADTLTERERECVYWTAAGKTSSEVADILGISVNTVNNYMTNSATKLDTVNKAHTVAKAIRYGLLNK